MIIGSTCCINHDILWRSDLWCSSINNIYCLSCICSIACLVSRYPQYGGLAQCKCLGCVVCNCNWFNVSCSSIANWYCIIVKRCGFKDDILWRSDLWCSSINNIYGLSCICSIACLVSRYPQYGGLAQCKCLGCVVCNCNWFNVSCSSIANWYCIIVKRCGFKDDILWRSDLWCSSINNIYGLSCICSIACLVSRYPQYGGLAQCKCLGCVVCNCNWFNVSCSSIANWYCIIVKRCGFKDDILWRSDLWCSSINNIYCLSCICSIACLVSRYPQYCGLAQCKCLGCVVCNCNWFNVSCSSIANWYCIIVKRCGFKDDILWRSDLWCSSINNIYGLSCICSIACLVSRYPQYGGLAQCKCLGCVVCNCNWFNVSCSSIANWYCIIVKRCGFKDDILWRSDLWCSSINNIYCLSCICSIACLVSRYPQYCGLAQCKCLGCVVCNCNWFNVSCSSIANWYCIIVKRCGFKDDILWRSDLWCSSINNIYCLSCICSIACLVSRYPQYCGLAQCKCLGCVVCNCNWFNVSCSSIANWYCIIVKRCGFKDDILWRSDLWCSSINNIYCLSCICSIACLVSRYPQYCGLAQCKCLGCVVCNCNWFNVSCSSIANWYCIIVKRCGFKDDILWRSDLWCSSINNIYCLSCICSIACLVSRYPQYCGLAQCKCLGCVVCNCNWFNVSC